MKIGWVFGFSFPTFLRNSVQILPMIIVKSTLGSMDMMSKSWLSYYTYIVNYLSYWKSFKISSQVSCNISVNEKRNFAQQNVPSKARLSPKVNLIIHERYLSLLLSRSGFQWGRKNYINRNNNCILDFSLMKCFSDQNRSKEKLT